MPLLFLKPDRADLLVNRVKRDLPAAGGEAFEVADGQDRGAVQGLEDGGNAVLLGGADEQDVAVAGILDVREPPDDDPAIVDALATQRVVEDPPEGVIPE